MQKRVIFTVLAISLILSLSFASAFSLSEFWGKITGNVVSSPQSNSPPTSVGPSQQEQSCMMTCMKCTSPGVGCTGNQAQCQTDCNMQKSESTPETSCMETCTLNGCSQYDFTCQNKNKESCEKECNMLGDKPDESTMSEEQKCITKCVESIDPGLRCGASQQGETGGEVCQMCANQCVHLYAGPCLDEEKLEAKKKSCETCEHCYGEPKMGPSGEGWDCITDVECKDATSEFGDDAGTRPGIAKTVGNAIGNAFDKIGNFFSNLFSSDKEQQTETPSE